MAKMSKMSWEDFQKTSRYANADTIEVVDECGEEIANIDDIKPYAIVEKVHGRGGHIEVEVANLNIVGVYAMGLAGYEIMADRTCGSDYLYARYNSGSDSNAMELPRKYKVQYPVSGVPFIRPNGHRVRLNEVLRTNL